MSPIKLNKTLIYLASLLVLTSCATVSLTSKPADKVSSKPADKVSAIPVDKPSASIIANPSIPSSLKIYYKDGRLVNVAKCEGLSWLGCMSDAGKICNDLGYDILEKNTSKQTVFFFGDKDVRELYYICKEPALDLQTK